MHSEPDVFPIKLHALLIREVDLSRSLLESLEAEKVAVAGYDEQLLAKTLQQKEALVAELQSATTRRIEFMQSKGFPAHWSGMEQCMAAFPASGLEELFHDLSDLGRRCISENRMVGYLIGRRTQFIAKALESLSAPGELDHATYGEDGNCFPSPNARRLGSA